MGRTDDTAFPGGDALVDELDAFRARLERVLVHVDVAGGLEVPPVEGRLAHGGQADEEHDLGRGPRRGDEWRGRRRDRGDCGQN